MQIEEPSNQLEKKIKLRTGPKECKILEPKVLAADILSEWIREGAWKGGYTCSCQDRIGEIFIIPDKDVYSSRFFTFGEFAPILIFVYEIS